MKDNKIKVGIVGLVFGGAFPTIYRDHPDVSEVVICDKNEKLLKDFSEKFHFAKCCTSYEELLNSDVDAIHILTNIHTHADLAIKALRARKHCAVTVPMATTLEEIRNIIKEKEKSGKNYMMMETSVYTYQCLYVKHLLDSGRLGKIQYLRGTHFQDMEGWPDYWKGLPPLHYGTHAISPLLYLSGLRAESVHCLGSGTMRRELIEHYGNPYPVETAVFRLSDGKTAADVTRSLFETAHEYVEGFSVFGDKMSFEWNFEEEDPYIYEFTDSMEKTTIGERGKKIEKRAVHCPDQAQILPESIRKYTTEYAILDPEHPDMYMKQGGGHHGSHPHMVHEFVRSIIEEREPMIDVFTAADWTAAGICGHESAMKQGEEVIIPDFRKEFSPEYT